MSMFTPPIHGGCHSSRHKIDGCLSTANDAPSQIAGDVYISVIMPAFNAAGTISRIVDEFLNQSYKSAELIIVDDGSTDDTPLIIDEYARSNPEKVIVIHKPNGGVSTARNAGMRVARGIYYTFVDADDEISVNFLKNMAEGVERFKCDFVVAGYEKIPGNKLILTEKSFDKDKYQDIIMTRDIGVTFCKLYSADLIHKHNIKFPEDVKLSEDAIFYYRYLRHSQKCAFISACDYIYYAPASDRKYNITIHNELIAMEAMSSVLISLMSELNLDRDGVNRLHQRLLLSLRRVMYAIYALPLKNRAEIYGKINWRKLLPYIKLDMVSKTLIKNKLFLPFEFLRLFKLHFFHSTTF